MTTNETLASIEASLNSAVSIAREPLRLGRFVPAPVRLATVVSMTPGPIASYVNARMAADPQLRAAYRELQGVDWEPLPEAPAPAATITVTNTVKTTR